jgi:hypothetical protein
MRSSSLNCFPTASHGVISCAVVVASGVYADRRKRPSSSRWTRSRKRQALRVARAAVKMFEGNGGEHLRSSSSPLGVKYVFGNSATRTLDVLRGARQPAASSNTS